MAKRNYLVDGLSGAGKSSVYEELIRRGYNAITTDRAWKLRADMWDPHKAAGELERPEPDVLFVCGSSRNRDRFLPYFTKIFNLRIDDDTMRRRLEERTNNDFGKRPEDLELMLALNRNDEKPAGAIDVDATGPIEQVADEVLRLADCGAATSDSVPAPWSKQGAAIGQSFVISGSALQSEEFWDVVDRETITRIEYSWSGDLLATLMTYLGEHGIDLVHSRHEELASTISGTRAGSVFVLTPDHRERYLARLDPSSFDGAALRRYYEQLNAVTAAGVGYAMLDGIAFFRDTLAPLGSLTVAVLAIG